MKKRDLLIIAIVAVVLLAVILFVFLGGKSKNELVGTWKGLTDGQSRDLQIDTTFTFEEDGKVKYSNEFGFNSEGTYEINENKVTIKLSTWEKEKVYEFKVNDNKLTMTIDDPYSPSYTDMEKQEKE